MALDQSALYVLSIGIFIALMDRLKHRFLVFSICALPGTLLHELSHFLVAAVTGGQPSSVSVIPRRVAGGYLLGQVGLRNPHAYNVLLIGLAPLALLPIAYWLFHWTTFNHASQPVWLVCLCIFAIASLIYGSLPSSADLRLIWRYGRVTVALLGCMGLGILFWF